MSKPMTRIEIINNFERITGFTPNPQQVHIIKALQSGKKVQLFTHMRTGKSMIDRFLRELHKESVTTPTKENV